MLLSSLSSKSGAVATSHGLKATMLSWACDYGIAEDYRAALGYHVGKDKNPTVWVYSRDRLMAPLAE
eukprot:11075169-Karenia_brevis.AAC.1